MLYGSDTTELADICLLSVVLVKVSVSLLLSSNASLIIACTLSGIGLINGRPVDLPILWFSGGIVHTPSLKSDRWLCRISPFLHP